MRPPARRRSGNRSPIPKGLRNLRTPRLQDPTVLRQSPRHRKSGHGRSDRADRRSAPAATSVGFRSSCPPGQRTIGSSSAVTLKRSTKRLRTAIASGIELLIADGRCGEGNWSAAARRVVLIADDDRSARLLSINPTRRRIRARMSRSPRSASAMSSARNRSGGIATASTSVSAFSSTRYGRPES